MGDDVVLMAHFTTADEALFLAVSHDADDPARTPSFTSLADGRAVDRALSGTIRDPALSPGPLADGCWYLAFTRLPRTGVHYDTPTGPVLGLRRSRDLVSWEDVGDGTLPVGRPELTRCWAPKWVADGDGIHLVFSGTESAGPPTPFGFFELHPIAGDPAGAWSRAEPLVGEFPVDRLDASIVRQDDGRFVCVFKNRLVHELAFAVAPALLGPYTPCATGADWGMQEGPLLRRLTDGRWRLFFDWPDNAPENYRFADSDRADLTTARWSGPRGTWGLVTTDAVLRHGTMVRLAASEAELLAEALSEAREPRRGE